MYQESHIAVNRASLLAGQIGADTGDTTGREASLSGASVS